MKTRTFAILFASLAALGLLMLASAPAAAQSCPFPPSPMPPTSFTCSASPPILVLVAQCVENIVDPTVDWFTDYLVDLAIWLSGCI